MFIGAGSNRLQLRRSAMLLAVSMQSEVTLALTLTLPPGEGSANGRVGKNLQMVNLIQRWKKFSLSPGERAGVRASVNPN